MEGGVLGGASGTPLPQELGNVGDAIDCRGGAPWHPPTEGVDVGLVVNNTLTAGAGIPSLFAVLSSSHPFHGPSRSLARSLSLLYLACACVLGTLPRFSTLGL
jgi:hypothetical protein